MPIDQINNRLLIYIKKKLESQYMGCVVNILAYCP